MLFDYCTAVLRLSEDATCTRTAVAGACRRFPVILDLLASGATNLTNIRRRAGKLTPENHEAILARAVHRTREEIEVLLRELDPLPDLRSSVRKAAVPAGVGSPTAIPADAPSQRAIGLPPAESAPSADPPPPAPRPVVRPSAPERYHVKFTIGEEAHRRLRRVQTLLRREIPDGDPGVIFDRALAALLEKVEKAKLGTTSTPRSGPSIRSGTDSPAARPSRHIPSEVKRAVSKRDADQCAFVAPDGRRCTQRAFLEYHHVQPFAKQGPATVENISCGAAATINTKPRWSLVAGTHRASASRARPTLRAACYGPKIVNICQVFLDHQAPDSSSSVGFGSPWSGSTQRFRPKRWRTPIASSRGPTRPSLIERNRAAHLLLVDGVPVEYRRKDGSISGAQARVIDFGHA